MSEEMIKVQVEDGVGTVTMNRPESLNAMTTAFSNRFEHELRWVARDPAIRAVIVTGAGRAFCAGGDLKNLGQADPLDPLSEKYGDQPIWNDIEMRTQRVRDSAMDCFYLLHSMPKPTIAMVNGPAIGAGTAPALACDFRIVSDQAYFNSGYANVGLSGDAGTNYFLTVVVGPAKAREILFFPRKIEAEEALRLGLATRVVPHAQLEEETKAFARQLAQGPTIAYGHMKENLLAAQLDPRFAFDIEARNFIRCFQTEDNKEAVAAFKEKRNPVFKGR